MTYDTEDFWNFVETHAGDDVSTLRLRYYGDVVVAQAITQIACRQRFGKKLAQTLGEYPRLLFANELCGEQSTSDSLARIHASLVPEGLTVTDLTSGLGIDAMHIAAAGHKVDACEIDGPLADALRRNAAGRGIDNLHVRHGDSVKMLHDGVLHGDVAFIDPARRGSDGRRLFSLTDCAPDVTSMLNGFRLHFKKLIIKASPMIDIVGGISNPIGCVTDVYALGSATQCGELVAVCDLGRQSVPDDALRIHAMTALNNGEVAGFTFIRTEETAPPPEFKTPHKGDVLYEPYPAAMKSGGFRTMAHRFGVAKIAADTHLYVHDAAIPGFPGQAWRVVEVLPWQSRILKRLKSCYPKISVAARNFDMSAEALRARLGVKEGDGSLKLTAVTLADGSKAMLVLER